MEPRKQLFYCRLMNRLQLQPKSSVYELPPALAEVACLMDCLRRQPEVGCATDGFSRNKKAGFDPNSFS